MISITQRNEYVEAANASKFIPKYKVVDYRGNVKIHRHSYEWVIIEDVRGNLFSGYVNSIGEIVKKELY